MKGRTVTQFPHESVDLGERLRPARRRAKAESQEAGGRIAHGFAAGGLHVGGTGYAGKGAGKAAYGFAQQIGLLRAGTVHRPSIVQGYAGVEEVAGVDRGPSEVAANSL